MSRRFRVSCPHQPARRIEGSVSTPGAGEIGPSKSLARCFRPGVVIATELRQRRPKPSTFRTLTPRFGGSEDQPLYGVARWLGRTAPNESVVRGRLHWNKCSAFVAVIRLL